jgi:hypothetical protein
MATLHQEKGSDAIVKYGKMPPHGTNIMYEQSTMFRAPAKA